MTRFAICSSFYEAGRPFLADWIAGVRAAAEGRDCAIIVAADDLRDAAATLPGLGAAFPVVVTDAPEDACPAAVRRTMLGAAARSQAEILVFVDMDDRLLPDALDLHEAALVGLDFSYGDLLPIDRDGRPVGPSFFSEADVPAAIDCASAILDRNWLGFSNVALRRVSLPTAALGIPDEVIAADWWFFTVLLASARRGRRTTAPVAAYRTHEGNLVGARPDPAPDALLRRLEILRRHYGALPDLAGTAQRLTTVESMAAAMATEPTRYAASIARACRAPGVWYADIARLAADWDGSPNGTADRSDAAQSDPLQASGRNA